MYNGSLTLAQSKLDRVNGTEKSSEHPFVAYSYPQHHGHTNQENCEDDWGITVAWFRKCSINEYKDHLYERRNTQKDEEG